LPPLKTGVATDWDDGTTRHAAKLADMDTQGAIELSALALGTEIGAEQWSRAKDRSGKVF